MLNQRAAKISKSRINLEVSSVERVSAYKLDRIFTLRKRVSFNSCF